MRNKRIFATYLTELMVTKCKEHLLINQEIEPMTEHSFNQEN